MNDRLEEIWGLLEDKIRSGDYIGNRAYRRLDLERETGLRLGIVSPGNVRELLIQIDTTDEESFVPPKWMGMRFEIIFLDVPERRTRHIRLYLQDVTHEPVFTTVCADIVETLLKVEDPSNRPEELQNCLDRWSRFFQKYGIEGLSPEAQRGLYGELSWLKLLLSCNMNPLSAIESWKGCSRNYHDFESNGKVVEVKTTMTKEPRRVHINNERQLDDLGSECFYLYVLTLHAMDSGGQTLPDLVNEIRDILKGHSSAENLYEIALKDAGYLDIHVSSYNTGYIQKRREIFEVKEGFPRITNLPKGIGDISYSLMISACADFEVDLEMALSNFIGAGTNG